MNDKNGKWITINGTHIFIKEGQSPMDAFIRQKGRNRNNDFNYISNDDIKEKYKRMSQESSEKLDKKELDLINEKYIGTLNSAEFNRSLKENNVKDVELMKALDKACETYTVKDNLSSVRFNNLKFIKNTYNLDTTQDKKILVNEMKKYIGKETSSKGYTSVSLNEDGTAIFRNLPVEVKIDIPKDTKMYVAGNFGEYEAILGRNKKMILKSVNLKYNNNKEKILLNYEIKE